MDPQEKRIYIAIIITAFVLGVVIVYFIISIIKQQKRNLELQKANILAEISAMEKERTRIAADLHDDLGPILSVIKFQVDNLQMVNEEDKEQMAQASQYLDTLIGRLREIANNLMPSALHRKGLVTAVEEFIHKAETANGLQIGFRHPDDLLLTEEKSINIYRAIQEVVHNCIKHARATRMEIDMDTKNGSLVILCKDNGQGFDYQKMSKESNGIGLKSLKNRTEMMGGTLVVESKPGTGSAFLFEIPVS